MELMFQLIYKDFKYLEEKVNCPQPYKIKTKFRIKIRVNKLKITNNNNNNNKMAKFKLIKELLKALSLP